MDLVHLPTTRQTEGRYDAPLDQHPTLAPDRAASLRTLIEAGNNNRRASEAECRATLACRRCRSPSSWSSPLITTAPRLQNVYVATRQATLPCRCLFFVPPPNHHLDLRQVVLLLHHALDLQICQSQRKAAQTRQTFLCPLAGSRKWHTHARSSCAGVTSHRRIHRVRGTQAGAAVSRRLLEKSR